MLVIVKMKRWMTWYIAWTDVFLYYIHSIFLYLVALSPLFNALLSLCCLTGTGFRRRVRMETSSWRCFPSTLSSFAFLCNDWNWLPVNCCDFVCYCICNSWRTLHRVSGVDFSDVYQTFFSTLEKHVELTILTLYHAGEAHC